MIKQKINSEINTVNRFGRSGRIKSQRLINTMLKAKRENQDITINELNYLARGFQECQRG